MYYDRRGGSHTVLVKSAPACSMQHAAASAVQSSHGFEFSQPPPKSSQPTEDTGGWGGLFLTRSRKTEVVCIIGTSFFFFFLVS
jgi:hypothetical protein